MRKIKHLPRKKQLLEKKRDELKRTQVTDKIFTFEGNCGKLHAINTAADANGMPSGTFFRTPKNTVILFLGTGKPCNPTKEADCASDGCGMNDDVLWFVDPAYTGVTYATQKTFAEVGMATI